VQVRNVISILYLIVFALFETYSAIATVLDSSGRFPTWEAKFGWGLFILPSLIIIGTALLLFGKRVTLGIYLVASSLLLYMGFLFFEVLALGRLTPADWVVISIWTTLCAIAAGAGWVLRQRSVESEKGSLSCFKQS